MKKIILYILRGIGLGCVFFTLSGIIFDIIFKGSFLLNHWYYTKMAIGSMITGIAFYVPSLVDFMLAGFLCKQEHGLLQELS